MWSSAGADSSTSFGSTRRPSHVYSGYGGDDVFHCTYPLQARRRAERRRRNDTFNLDNNFRRRHTTGSTAEPFDTGNLTGGSAAALTFGLMPMVGSSNASCSERRNYAHHHPYNTVAPSRLAVDASRLAGAGPELNVQAVDGAFLVLAAVTTPSWRSWGPTIRRRRALERTF